MGLVTLFTLKMRSDALDDAGARAVNVASILAEQVDSAVDSLDASLRAMVRTLSTSSASSLADAIEDPDARAEFANQRNVFGFGRLIGVVGADGHTLGGANGKAYAGIDLSDRSYFRDLQANPGTRLVISEPLQNRATGEWMIFFARALTNRDGTFRGLVFVGTPPEGLLRASDAIGSIPGQSFGLFDREGRLLVRYPEALQNAETGAVLRLPQWQAAVNAGGGSYRSDGYYDGKPKLVVAHPLDRYPFVVSASITDEGALARWRSRAWVVVAGGAAALLVLFALLLIQLRLRRKLSRARLRNWLRVRRLNASNANLTEVRRRFGVTLDYMSHGMAMFDGAGKLIVSNDAFARLYSIDPAQIHPGLDVATLVELRIAAGAYSGPSPDAYRLYMVPPFPKERLDHLKNGRILLVRTKRIEDGGWVAMHEDVTERIASTERLAYLAMHDRLTGLPNREAFRKMIDSAAQRCQRDEKSCALVLLDIDDFKAVNDVYGHEIGDRILVELAGRFQEATPEAYIARLGGDEFIAFVHGGDSAMNPHDIGKRLARSMQRPFACDGREITISASMGALALQPADSNPRQLLRRADLALAAAKGQGGGACVLFEPQMERDFDARVGLAEQLRAAIAADQLELHYQPIIDANDGSIVCMEALVRWRHPVKGMVSPAVFIPLAEQSGSIGELGEWVMRRACADAVEWPARTIVAVNVSPLQITRPNFAESVSQIIADSGLPPARLQIEITETVLLQNDAQIVDELNALRDLGVTFALDDFGTGYASLGYLKSFPLDKIKIDKSFVDDICTAPQLIAIVSAAVVLARGLSIGVTAEGVETREQFETLRALGVGTMQGYYLGRPRPIAEQGFAPVCVQAA